MLKQLFLPLAGVAAFIIFVGFFTQGKIKFGTQTPTPTPDARKIIKIGAMEIKVDVADSGAKREKGLSGISKLNENEGMLFVFDEKDATPSFWMKGMKINLDIIWIDDGKIVKIDKNVPFFDQEKLYMPGQPIDYVLEVSAGFSDKNGVKVGQNLSGL